MHTSPTHTTSTDAPQGLWLKARQVLHIRKIWLLPIVMTTIVVSVLSSLYIGSVINPTGHLHDLPVMLVNQDDGAVVQGQRIDIGESVSSSLRGSDAVTSRLKLEPATLAQARDSMNRGDAYATIVIPSTFTKSVLLATGKEPASKAVPANATITIQENRRLGSSGVNMGTQVIEQGIEKISPAVGNKLAPLADASAKANPISASRLADPLTITTVDYRPLPDHTALGMSAFYIALLSIMAGFIGGTLINSTVDSALGYGVSEIGPKRKQSRPLPINRRQTFLTKLAVAVVAAPILTGVLLLVAVGALGMYAPHLMALWGVCAMAAFMIAVGMLALQATFGSLGQLVGTILLVYLSLASSGGTVPMHALPDALQTIGGVEPLRQVMTATRSIIYFDARGDAGLDHALVMITVLTAFWAALGLFITGRYDRKGRHRITPDMLAYVNTVIDERIADVNAEKDDDARATTRA